MYYSFKYIALFPDNARSHILFTIYIDKQDIFQQKALLLCRSA